MVTEALVTIPEKVEAEMARYSGVSWGGRRGGGTVDSPLWNDESTCGLNNELNMLTRLLSSLFHLFASIVGRSLLIPDGVAQSLRSGSG